jgi:hypothetical protein
MLAAMHSLSGRVCLSEDKKANTPLNIMPNYLREIAPRWNVQVMAQNGRTIRDFSIPRDLWTTGDRNETVVYFLGANDILQRNAIEHPKYRLQRHVNFLLERNFKVLLIVPPTFGLDDATGASLNQEHRALFEDYRGTRPNLWVYDIDNVWDRSETSDGIHPNPYLSREIVMTINMVLSMNIYQPGIGWMLHTNRLVATSVCFNAI